MINKPKISMIIPVYNTEKYLEKCLNSIVNQSFKDIEIIVINDGSTDNSLKIINKFAKKDKRIKVINKKNEGVSIARNTGIDIAKGKFLSFVDSDDFMDNKHALKKLYLKAKENGAEIVLGNFNFITAQNNKNPYFPKKFFTDPNNFDKNGFLIKKTHLLNLLTQGVWGKIYLKKFIDENKIRFKEKTNFEDTLFSIEITLKSKKIATIPETVYNYFIGNPESFSRKNKGKEQLDFLKIRKLSIEFIKSTNNYEKYFKNLIWLILPIDKFKIIDLKYKKIFLKELNQQLDKNDFELIKQYGDQKQIKFTQQIIKQQYATIIIIEKINEIKTKIKNISKKIYTKFNINYRYQNYLLTLNKQIFEKESEIEQKLCKIESKIKSIQNTKNLEQKLENLEEKNNYIETLIKVSTDITKIPKATGNLRKIQEKSVLLLKKFDEVCKKNNLKYWLDGGTLLGAYRHNGFIPWDDDLDISMMTDDYEKFCLIANKEFKESSLLFKKVPSQIGKITHKDFSPSNNKEWVDFIFWRLENKICFALDIFPFYSIKNNLNLKEASLIIKKNCEIIKKMYKKFKQYNDFKNIEKIIKKNNKQISSKTTTDNIFLGLETLANQPVIRSYKDIFPLKEKEFEGLKLWVPNHSKKILDSLYGNFMEFPKDIYPQHLNLKKINEKEIINLNK